MLNLKKQTPKIINFLLIVNSLILVIPNKLKAYPIILLLVMCIIFSYVNKDKAASFPYKKVLTISFLFIIYLLSLSYSQMYKDGFSRLSTMSSIVAFPLIFGILNKNNYCLSKKTINSIFVGFII